MTYQVVADPEGRYWHVRVPAINRSTQARNIKEIPVMVTDLIEIITGETNPELSVELPLRNA
jgi:hypothetical protein